uniref:Uncharacterized protein n=1 Tax=Glossina pallidipes TaxID=7398 RepID=A0A1B0A052_GLOPL
MESSIMLCEATVSQLEAQQQRLRQNSCSPPNTAATNNSILQQQQHLHMQLSDTTTRSTGSSNSSININNTEMSQINTNMAGNNSSNSISGGVGMGVLLNAAATGLSYGGSGPSSLVNSPALGRRKRYTSNSSNCSSQFNNNYAGLDVESLEDMLRKRSADFKLSTQHSFTAGSATIIAVTLGYCGVAFKRKCNFFQDKLPGS